MVDGARAVSVEANGKFETSVEPVRRTLQMGNSRKSSSAETLRHRTPPVSQALLYVHVCRIVVEFSKNLDGVLMSAGG